jgi:ribose 5-phosphate isomerase B
MKNMLLIPLAGYGKRFGEAGYYLPKQLLQILGKTTLEYSLESIVSGSSFDVVILLRSGLMTKHDLRPIFNKYFNRECKFIEVIDDTRGSLETCLLARPYIDPESRLHIFTLDVKFAPQTDITKIDFGGSNAQISLVKTNNPGYSYAQVDPQDGRVTKVAEKRIISNYGATGLYSFAKADEFFEFSKRHISKGLVINKEFYISDVYRVYLEQERAVSSSIIDSIYSFGTPGEYEWCVNNLKNKWSSFGFASDHSGFVEKDEAAEYFRLKKYEVLDVGCFSNNDCDYPDFVGALCKDLLQGRVDFGISICRSGQGVNIAANKIRGIRSVLFTSIDDLKISLKHNLPNHLAVPSVKVKEIMSEEFCRLFDGSPFEGGRHQDRLMDAEKYE